MADLVDVAALDVAEAIAALMFKDIDPHVIATCCGANGQTVENECGPLLGSNKCKHPTPPMPPSGVYHTLRERTGNHCIDGIAAGSKNPDSGFDRLGLRSDSHPH
jgi:hypothetical protein